MVNSFFNNVNFSSIKISLSYIRYGIFVIAIIYVLNKDEKILKYFFYVLFFTFFLLVGDGFLQYLTGKNILGFEIVEANRISSFFHDELILGSYLSRLWPIFFGLSIFFASGFLSTNSITAIGASSPVLKPAFNTLE